MTKPKAKTIQEKFGFLDSDITKPLHDDIIKWIDCNVEDILMQLVNLQKRPKTVTRWEAVVRQTDKGGGLIGSVDLAVRHGYHTVLFEAKTVMPTLGELFRQVRMYQEGYIGSKSVSGMPFVIVSPDDTKAEMIREQRLLFLKYDPEMSFTNLGGI